MFIEIDTPRIARAFGENFELVLNRMITPHAGIDARAFAIRSAEFTDVRVREHTVATIKPAIRAPGKSIKRFVRVLVGETIEENLRLAGRFRLITILHRYEHQEWSRSYPNSAESNFQTAHQIQSFHEDRAFVELPVSIGIFEDENAILALTFRCS